MLVQAGDVRSLYLLSLPTVDVYYLPIPSLLLVLLYSQLFSPPCSSNSSNVGSAASRWRKWSRRLKWLVLSAALIGVVENSL